MMKTGTVNPLKISSLLQWLRNFQEPFHDTKFYLIFFNSAINPLIYGYWNVNMRRAFRLTFPCFFGCNAGPKYILRREYVNGGGGGGNLKFSFIKMVSSTDMYSEEK